MLETRWHLISLLVLDAGLQTWCVLCAAEGLLLTNKIHVGVFLHITLHVYPWSGIPKKYRVLEAKSVLKLAFLTWDSL